MRKPANNITLGLMTKYWDVGEVKTRLGTSIGMARAASLHRLFVVHLCKSLSTFDGRRVICMTPESKHIPFRSELRTQGLGQDWETMPQTEGNLGNRLESWFDAVFHDPSRPATQAIVIGADCPSVSVAQIEDASHHLSTHDVVLGPAADGGYYLLGISAPWSISRFHTIFDDIPWSTDEVFRTTRTRLADAGLSCFELEVGEDIDTMAELNRFREKLAAVPRVERSVATSSQLAELASAIEKILDKTAVDDIGAKEIQR